MFRPKKSLGQNFLKSKEALRSIIEAGDIQPDDLVIEVGPGKGVLTEELVKRAGNVIAIEKDARLIPILQQKFRKEIEHSKLEIIEQDILKFDPASLSGAELLTRSSAPDTISYKIVANIPYYITGALIKKFLTSTFQPERMVLLLQKEVAERIVARASPSGRTNGKESLLSISVKAYGRPKYIQTVKAKYFSPQPNVDSAIILIENISKNNFKDISEERFFELVRAGFAHKRKMLIGNLKTGFPEKHWDEIFEKLSVPKKARAEDVPLEMWLEFAQFLGNFKQ